MLDFIFKYYKIRSSTIHRIIKKDDSIRMLLLALFSHPFNFSIYSLLFKHLLLFARMNSLY